MAGTTHEFAAIAFEENLSLRELAPAFPGARLGVRELVVPCDGGEMFLYPFGAIVFHNVSLERREVGEVIASSTGNHGAAVAYAARLLGRPARIFLPEHPHEGAERDGVDRVEDPVPPEPE